MAACPPYIIIACFKVPVVSIVYSEGATVNVITLSLGSKHLYGAFFCRISFLGNLFGSWQMAKLLLNDVEPVASTIRRKYI
jgi:hypothetical protein